MTTGPALSAIIPAAGSSRRLAHLTRSRPKSLLNVAGRSILEHGLAALARRAVSRVLLVVGYRHRDIEAAIGARVGSMRVDYVRSADYATTEHGHSVQLSRAWWAAAPGPVLLLDADNVYHPDLLDLLTESDSPSRILVDPSLDTRERDEELTLGQAGIVEGLVRGRLHDHPRAVGGFVGMNRFDARFMERFYTVSAPLLAAHDRMLKYERLLDATIRECPEPVGYETIPAGTWVNVNYEPDLDQAQRILGGGFPATVPRGR